MSEKLNNKIKFKFGRDMANEVPKISLRVSSSLVVGLLRNNICVLD